MWLSTTGARDTSRILCCAAWDVWAQSTIMPRRFISSTTSTPNSVMPPCRASSVALSIQSRVSLWHSVISLTPAAYQTRKGANEFSSPMPLSTVTNEAILPAFFARATSLARVAGRNTSGWAAAICSATSICSSVTRAGLATRLGTNAAHHWASSRPRFSRAISVS